MAIAETKESSANQAGKMRMKEQEKKASAIIYGQRGEDVRHKLAPGRHFCGWLVVMSTRLMSTTRGEGAAAGLGLAGVLG